MRRSVLVAIALFGPNVLAAQTDGWRYATRITTDSGDGKSTSTTMRRIVTAKALRTEIGLAPGSYTIYVAADSTSTHVMASAHAATRMQLTPRPAKVTLPVMTPHYTKHDFEDLGVGEPILGYPTHHYRTTTKGTMDITVGGQTCSRAVNDVAELWIAEGVDLRPALDMELKQYGSSANQVLGEMRFGPSEPRFSKGTPLRTISHHTIATSSGQSRIITTTMEYIELAHEPISDSLFVVPSDFRIMDFRKMRAVTQAQLDSIQANTPSPFRFLCNG